MALVCDICKERPATARVAFLHDGHQQVVDVCQEDFVKLQSGNPGLIQSMLKGEETYAHALVKRAGKVATEFGQAYIGSEHLLIALVTDEAHRTYLDSLKLKVDDVRNFLTANTAHELRKVENAQLSSEAKTIMGDAHQFADEEEAEVSPSHVIRALLEDEGVAGRLLRSYGLTEESVREAAEEQVKEKTDTRTLDKYSRDLTALARKGSLDPVIGRESEIETTIEVLSRRTKNNPVLIGEPGVGKTAIVEGLAQRIILNQVPSALKGKRLVELSLNGMVAGARYRGEFEERIQNVLKEIVANKEKLLVFIDELHTVVGAGAGEGSLDAANVLKPALARGELHMIGATTLNEYQKHIEKDSALERRFQPITVGEPSLEDTLLIIDGLKPKYEEHHKVLISAGAVKAAVELSDRYLTQRFLPDKAIDLIDQAASRVRIRHNDAPDMVVTDAHIAEVLAKLTGIPVTQLTKEERERLLNLEERLHARVIGQDAAVKSVASAIRVSRAGLTDRRAPIATLLFVGPTGVGKTELAKSLAAELFGSENALTRIDMSEYMERHAVSRLIGSPPGYVGFDEGGQLTEAVRRHPYSIILLDEIEKAHPDVANVLLQLFDDGRLTDGKGRTVDFSNAVIIATSNLGTEQHRQAKIGFQTGEAQANELKEEVLSQLRQHFRPEFINRLDEIVSFHALNEDEIEQIVTLQLERVRETVAKQGVEFTWTPSVATHFAEVGFDERFGARELKRRIRLELENVLAEKLLSGSVKKGKIKAECKAGILTLS
jgi:ATP-dependent Clp protease ATP-binding subunit ClpC